MKRYLPILQGVFFVGTFLFLQIFNKYHFYFVEQFQLFQTTFLYFAESISHPGGGIEYLSYFFVQFFIVPYVGAFIEALFLFFIYLLAFKLFNRTGLKKISFIAAASVYLSCLLLSFDFNYRFQGILSYFVCLACLYFAIEVEYKSGFKYVIPFFVVVLLYWVAGSVSVLFALCFMSYAVLQRESGKKRVFWLFLPLFAILVSWLGVRLSLTGYFRMSFLPDMYYQPKLEPGSLIYLPWILLPAWITTGFFVKETRNKKSNGYFSFGMQMLLISCLFIAGVRKYGDRKSYELKKLDYYARNEQWDKIIRESEEKEINNYLQLNYLNMALVQKGLLGERMLNFFQKGVAGLYVPRKKAGIVSMLLSDICFCTGDIASSQRYAFEGYEVSSGGGGGRLLKRLIQTNLIYGEYSVAKKYIDILEHTVFYKDWAERQRRFLYNDSLCISDPVIGKKRDCLLLTSPEVLVKSFSEMLKMLTEFNPDNKFAWQYLFAWHLLAKDKQGFISCFSDEYRKIVQKLPVIYQQALVAFYERYPEKWISMGVSESTIQLFKMYKSMEIKNSRNPAIKELMRKHFGSTYWFYLQFV